MVLDDGRFGQASGIGYVVVILSGGRRTKELVACFAMVARRHCRPRVDELEVCVLRFDAHPGLARLQLQGACPIPSRPVTCLDLGNVRGRLASLGCQTGEMGPCLAISGVRIAIGFQARESSWLR